TNGARQKALLQEVTEEGIKISYSVMKKEEGMKKKVKETVEEFLTFKDIKSAKPIIKF
ncbi:MAG: ribosome assembly cofactor RimP, partial [Bacteroidaceae bacterium]|nr:ribosome assembly cofactor RimP [Bacteroidaceae bacterium]